ncbi:hypothetical protein [Parafrankia elaeagni]|uniref:hypothetical protein n=1 Tax=Parafrankia elaeagni TaxID=222534 RepID=UPI00036DD228|nr:hypothetical protein [Parafrankia elaeagni]
MTYNTINKWAAGISDNYALGVLAATFELWFSGRRPAFCQLGLAADFAFQRGVTGLREAGAELTLDGTDRMSARGEGPRGTRGVSR